MLPWAATASCLLSVKTLMLLKVMLLALPLNRTLRFRGMVNPLSTGAKVREMSFRMVRPVIVDVRKDRVRPCFLLGRTR